MVADPHRGGPRAGNEHVAVGGQRTRVKGDEQVGFQGEPSGKPGADQLVAELAAFLPAGAGDPEHAIVDVRRRRRGLGQGRPGCRDDRRDRGDRVERRRVTTPGRAEAEALPSGATTAARVEVPPTSTARTFMVRVACPPVKRKLALLVVVVIAGLTACGGDDDDAADETVTEPGGCAEVDPPPARGDGGATAPTATLDPAETWTLTFETSCGSFVVTLDLESAPDTAASLVALAEDGYFDDTVFHRIVPDFVIQGGDPTQTGGGGPGYKTVDVPATDATYTRGVVAMAKAGTGAGGNRRQPVLRRHRSRRRPASRVRRRRRGHRRARTSSS